MTTFVVAERHDLVRAGIEALLRNSGHEIVGEAAGVDGLLRSVKVHRPSAAILSQNVAEGGMQFPRQLKQLRPCLRIIVLLECLDADSSLELIGPDTDGVVLRDASADQLLECVKSVCAGHRWLDPQLVHYVLRPEASNGANGHSLTPRENSISDLVARGLRNKQIARAMRISESTVKMHLHHIYSKLRLSGRTELALVTHSKFRANGGQQHEASHLNDLI